MQQPTQPIPLRAVSVAEAHVKVRQYLGYSGPLQYDVFKGNNGDTLLKFHPTSDKSKIVYVRI